MIYVDGQKYKFQTNERERCVNGGAISQNRNRKYVCNEKFICTAITNVNSVYCTVPVIL